MKIEVTVSGTGKGVPRLTKKLDIASPAAALRKLTSLSCPTHRWRPKGIPEDDDSIDVLDVCCVTFRDQIFECLRSSR